MFPKLCVIKEQLKNNVTSFLVSVSQVGSVKHILKEQRVAENCVYQPIMLTDFTSGFKVNSDKSTSCRRKFDVTLQTPEDQQVHP